MSVRNSMYRMVFTLIVIPFLLFSFLITQIYSWRLENVIAESLHVVADAQVGEMTTFCEQQKDYMELTGNMDMSRAAMRGELDEGLTRYLDNMLYSQVQAMQHINTVTILNRNYRIAACSEEHESFADQGIENLIHDMKGKPFYISDVLTDGQEEKTLVGISEIKESGEVLGYTLVELNLDFYKKIRENAELWNESTFYLLDGKSQIISAGTPHEKRESFVTTEKEREDYNKKYSALDFDKNPKGSFQFEAGGKNYITYYSDVEYTDWLVLLTVNLDNYQEQKTVYFVMGFFLVVLCTLLAFWISSFASKRIVYPIKSISGTLKAIQEKQDYTLRAEVERKDELGSLAVEINELIDFIETEDLYKTRRQRLLQEKAEQDALTKVLNKEKINECLQESIETHRRDGTKMAVLFVDIDDFKFFNTKYGHNVGDQVLLFLTSVLARETKGKVGRAGGDEFLVIIEEQEYVEKLDSCLEQIAEVTAGRFVVRGSGTHLPVYCSIGAVRIDFKKSGMKELTQNQLSNLADEAMYQAKNNGKRGHVIVDYRE